jgi:SAM-dependent methyltransferase
VRYELYKQLQDFVHAGHYRQKAVLERQLAEHKAAGGGPRVLELACGGGNLASVIPPESYRGIDSAPERIEAARPANPGYRFDVCDVTSAEGAAAVGEADFVFCHGLLHHLDDVACRELVAAIESRATRPATFVAIEPFLPQPFRHPAWYLFGKLDDGRFMRRANAYRVLSGDWIVHTEVLDFSPRWPGDEEVYVWRFPISPAEAV